jgi:hypothetical protein
MKEMSNRGGFPEISADFIAEKLIIAAHRG